MKNKLWLLGLLVSATLMAAIVVTKVSQYPNVTTPGTNDFFLLAITNAPATNHNIKYSALKAAINATNVNGSGSASTLAKWSGTSTLASAAIGTGLTFDGTTLSRDAITGDVTTSGDVATIANSAVTDAKVSSSAAI